MKNNQTKTSYSVVIRTLGNGGEAYKQLLQSIQCQTIQPEEIIVVIPKGYTLDYQLGTERIIYSEKGMCTQRAIGISAATSEYILVVDDDVRFEADMIERLYAYLQQNNLNCVLPMEGESDGKPTMNLRRPLFTRIRGAITGQYFESTRKSKYLDVLTTTAGHKTFVNNNDVTKLYYCNTACFQCIFINTKLAQDVHFEDERWLEQGRLTSYTAFDEPVFFSKIPSLRMAYALQVRYKHLDSKCGHVAKDKVHDKVIRYYSISRNRTVYWYRCLYKPSATFGRRLQVLCGGLYALVNYTLYNLIINLHPKNWPGIKAMFMGYRDAIDVIRQK